MKFLIYIEIVHCVEIVPLAWNSPAGASEWFHFCTNSDLCRNCTLNNVFPSGTSEFIPFWRQLVSYLEVKISRYSFSGIPLRFCWRHGITSFCRQLGSSFEFSCGHLGINSIWRQFVLPLELSIPGDSFLEILPCFSPLDFTLLICSWRTTFTSLGVYYSSPFLGNYMNYQNIIVRWHPLNYEGMFVGTMIYTRYVVISIITFTSMLAIELFYPIQLFSLIGFIFDNLPLFIPYRFVVYPWQGLWGSGRFGEVNLLIHQ